MQWQLAVRVVYQRRAARRRGHGGGPRADAAGAVCRLQREQRVGPAQCYHYRLH